MDQKDFEEYLLTRPEQLKSFYHRELPKRIGVVSKNFFENNFRLQGFLSSGLQPWVPAKRLSSGDKSAAANNPTLCSERNHLMHSIYYTPGDAAVTVINSLPYSAIHNNGGVIHPHPSVTPKMRKMAWARFFAAGGGKGKEAPPEAGKWKALALTKKTKLDQTVIMPKRQFMGDSPELRQEIDQTIEKGLSNILLNK